MRLQSVAERLCQLASLGTVISAFHACALPLSSSEQHRSTHGGNL